MRNNAHVTRDFVTGWREKPLDGRFHSNYTIYLTQKGDGVRIFLDLRKITEGKVVDFEGFTKRGCFLPDLKKNKKSSFWLVGYGQRDAWYCASMVSPPLMRSLSCVHSREVGFTAHR